MSEAEATLSQSKFYIVMQPIGGYTGSIKLPNGVQYGGTIRPQKGPKGVWYIGDLVASDIEQANADVFALRAGKVPENFDIRSSLQPGEIRLNPAKDGANYALIGEFWSPSHGLFTIFASPTMTRSKQAALRGSIVEKRKDDGPAPEPQPDTLLKLEGELEDGFQQHSEADQETFQPTQEQGNEARGRRRNRRGDTAPIVSS